MVRSKTWTDGGDSDTRPHFYLSVDGWTFNEEGLSADDYAKACEFCDYLNGRT